MRCVYEDAKPIGDKVIYQIGLIGLIGSHSLVSGFSQQANAQLKRASEGLRFNVVIREDAKVSLFTVAIVKAALSTHLF